MHKLKLKSWKLSIAYITHVGKLTLESEQLWSYSLVSLGTICVSMTHALQYNTLCPSGTLLLSGLPMMIWQKN